jgi:hypothetical protein
MKMGALDWLNFSLGAFAAILAQLTALRQAGIPLATAKTALVAQAQAAPGMTDDHKTVIASAADAAHAVAESIPGPVAA